MTQKCVKFAILNFPRYCRNTSQVRGNEIIILRQYPRGMSVVVTVCVVRVRCWWRRVVAVCIMYIMQYARVKRDGLLHSVNATELVIGDVITVVSGDQIPADMRIVSANGFKVQQTYLLKYRHCHASVGCSLDKFFELFRLFLLRAFQTNRAVLYLCTSLSLSLYTSV